VKANLESKEIHNRGVSLTSETDEEKEVLTNLWTNFWVRKVGPAKFARLPDGQVQIVFAPTIEDK
jgi:hypothetical protein